MAARAGPALAILTGNLEWTRWAPTVEITGISRVAVSRTVIKIRKIITIKILESCRMKLCYIIFVMLRYFSWKIRNLFAWNTVNVGGFFGYGTVNLSDFMWDIICLVMPILSLIYRHADKICEKFLVFAFNGFISSNK